MLHNKEQNNSMQVVEKRQQNSARKSSRWRGTFILCYKPNVIWILSSRNSAKENVELICVFRPLPLCKYETNHDCLVSFQSGAAEEEDTNGVNVENMM